MTNRRLFQLFILLAAMLLPMVAGAQTGITSLSDIGTSGDYIITDDIDASGFTTSIVSFSGTLEAAINPDTKMPYRITGLSVPLFTTLTGTVKNLVLEDVAISQDGQVGAIASTANGSARIYNVGILSGSVGGTGYTGGLVGLLAGNGRVVNCYSYATITGGTTVGGIIGRNDVATTAATVTTGTMVMNCMFYGDITGGGAVSPVYGGQNIDNRNSGGLTTFNYYAYEKLKSKSISDANFKCALAMEDKYLTRIEFYRLLLNSNKKLAAYYATGSADNGSQMLKWVLESADRTITDPKPYPILKAQGYYPSIINPDFTHAPDSSTVGRNKGGKLGRTLSVTITQKADKTDGGQSWPTATTSDVQTTSLTLIRTDKDPERFNFNYDKVQLPYYNDVGTGNYTENRVVTGWKITDITTIDGDPYTADNYKTSGEGAYPQDYPNFNFADRRSSNKDLYTVSGRVFSQGAYFDVPYGVTSITIEPYWGKAAYLADQYYDVVYKENSGKYEGQNVTGLGTQVGSGATFNGDANQLIKTNVKAAFDAISSKGATVYDNAIVLVGNFHQSLINVSPFKDNTPFTLMSVDMDNDHEPDYSLIYNDNNRTKICPIRFDFLNVPGTAQVQKPNGCDLVLNVSIVLTYGWFEITNTALMYFCQYEYENQKSFTKTYGPLILLGGYIDQFVSTQQHAVAGKTYFIHVGGNVLINAFGTGTHSDGSYATPHVPVSVTGGEYLGFYLSGTYNQNATMSNTNAECYISGGHFIEAAGAAQEQIGGDMHWQIYNADIDEFYGGGTNAAKPITGDVTVDIYNSYVTTYCGGPKFGDMQSGKKVTTNAEGCTFNKFYGAGYGGLSYSRKKYTDATTYNFSTLQNYYYKESDGSGDRGKYYDGATTASSQQGGSTNYGKKGPGVATDFDYEFFVWTSGKTGARFFVKFASFSLAQCNDVESNLKNCTINENFYGGGNLGKVTGTINSVLDDCTVKGNAFGAGFSATLPTLQVRDAGFAKDASNNYLLPKFNKYSCVFQSGTKSGTTEFRWQHVDNYPANGTIGIYEGVDDKYVKDTINLEKSNLGKVAAASLTLKGSTTVGTEGDSETGNVYGGGDESSVSGNTTVKLQEGVTVLGNVYGGGNNGPVEGDSEVKIEDD